MNLIVHHFLRALPHRTRPYSLIRTLARLGHQVTLPTAAGTPPEEQEQADELRGWGVRGASISPAP